MMILIMIKNPNQTLWVFAFKATRGTATYEVFLFKKKKDLSVNEVLI